VMLLLLLAGAAALRRPPARAPGPRSVPDFLEDNLGDASSAAEARNRPLTAPLGGVSVSPRGFVAVLVSSDATRALPVVVHRADVDAVTSPAALTLLQLIQGIDVAAASTLPADALERAFGADVELAKVRVIPATKPPPPPPAPRDEAFEAALGAASEKLRTVLATSLGVSVSLDVVEDSLRRHGGDGADLCGWMSSTRAEGGPPDSAAQARRSTKTRSSSCWRRREKRLRPWRATRAVPSWRWLPVYLWVFLDARRGTESAQVSTTGETADLSPFLGLALALRHKVMLDLGEGLFDVPMALDAGDLDLPVKRLDELIAEGAQHSATFATLFNQASKDAAARGFG